MIVTTMTNLTIATTTTTKITATITTVKMITTNSRIEGKKPSGLMLPPMGILETVPCVKVKEIGVSLAFTVRAPSAGANNDPFSCGNIFNHFCFAGKKRELITSSNKIKEGHGRSNKEELSKFEAKNQEKEAIEGVSRRTNPKTLIRPILSSNRGEKEDADLHFAWHINTHIGCDESAGAGVKTEILRILAGQVTTLAAMAEGEEISEEAVREVKKETDTKFVEVLAFRQWHQAFYRKSDLFFVCIMWPSSFDIQIQESEIEATKIEQYKTEIKRLRNMNIGTTKSASRLVEPMHPRYVDSVLGYEKEKMKCCEIKHKSPKQA
ncbi:hypothetical protein Tco_1142570 [Tanacetum coccineum]